MADVSELARGGAFIAVVFARARPLETAAGGYIDPEWVGRVGVVVEQHPALKNRPLHTVAARRGGDPV